MDNQNPIKKMLIKTELIEILEDVRLQSKFAIDIMKQAETHPAIVEAYQNGVDSVIELIKERCE